MCVRIQKVFTLFLLVSLQNGRMMYTVHQSWVCSVHSTVEMLNHTCSMSARKYFFKYSLYIVHILANFSTLGTLIYYSTSTDRTAALAETKRTAQLQTSVLVMVTSRRDASVLNIACYASSLSGSLVFKHTCSFCRIFCRS